uniref:DUF3298 domain-containing protein n=1 Tax=Solibacter usitatus (strain Ellin6076) TaxID=234267 RepID=Q01Y42_SOLUE
MLHSGVEALSAMTRLVVALLIAAAELPTFESRHIERTIPGCGDVKEGCVHVELTYVELVSGPEDVREKVNAAIRDAIVSRPQDGLKLTPAEYADHFATDYQKGSLSKSVKVSRASPPAISLEYSESSYTGGAHGNFATVYLNFEAATGETLKLASIVKAGSTARLTAIAEAHFRKQRELAPDASLKAAGFWFPEGRFQLSPIFGLSEKELIFQYNLYDVAPYSMGPTTVTIPFSEIRGLLRPM